MHQFILLMSVRGLLWGGCCVCTPRNSYQSTECSLSPRVCVQACTQGTIIPIDAPDIPPPPTRQVHLKPPPVNHTIHVPNLSFSTPPTPTTRTRLRSCFNIITMQLFGWQCTTHNWKAWLYIRIRSRQFCSHGSHRALQSTTDACTLSESDAYLAFADLS